MIRVVVSILVAGAVTAAAIALLWSPLDVKTSLIGYPVFADFNGYNYFTGYYLAVGFFPVAALLLFLLLTRVGPRFGLPAPPQRGPLRPPAGSAPEKPPGLQGDPPLAGQGAAKQRAVTAARIGFVGGVLGLEAGIATDETWLTLVTAIAIYATAVCGCAAAIERWTNRDSSWEEWLPIVNAIAAPLTVLGLWLVSSNTEVRVLSDGSVNHYPWFPIWLAIPAAAGLTAAIAALLRRGNARAVEIERGALLLVAAPVSLFLLLAVLPGDAGTFETFEAGQRLVAGTLVSDGWFPWRDVFVAHGMLADVIHPLVSFAVFENSYWGGVAGNGFLLGPLYLISGYFLLAYLFGRNWLFLLFCALVLIDGTVAPPDFRFILVPVVLLLLARVLNWTSPRWAIALGLLVVGQVLLTPEAAPMGAAVAVVLILYEWYWRKPGSSLAATFPRTIWFAATAAASVLVVAVYLASVGALDDLLYIMSHILRGHTLDGAIPPGGSLSDFHFYFLAIAPLAALLISFGYAVAQLRLRRPFRNEEWVLAVVAIFVFFYYSKFLARMDDHVYQPFVQALPLMLYILFRVVTSIEAAIRKRWAEGTALAWVAHPVSLVLVLAIGLTSAGWRDRVNDASARYSAPVPEQPAFQKVGYVSGFDAVAYRDLRRVVDTYLDPGDRLFDLTAEPGLFFYLMDREPSTRYILTNSITDTAELQGDVIDRLRESRPKLIVFDNVSPTFFGLSNYDGTPSMVRQYLVSQWILDRYRPLITTHGHTFYARRDLPSPDLAKLDMTEKPIVEGVEFESHACTWGYSPSFLSGPGTPGPGATSVDAKARPAPDRISVVGWAGDPAAKAPAPQVIATLKGRIVARTRPRIDRPDLLTYGLPEGFGRSGFVMRVPGVPEDRADQLRFFGVSRSGSLTELVPDGGRPSKGEVVVGGRTVRLTPNAVWGQINQVVGTRGLQIELPRGADWTDYRWLEVEAGAGGFRDGSFTIYDRQLRSLPQREISFQTLDRSPRRYVVPVGSCAQWHGYKDRRLFLGFGPGQKVAAVRLIR